MRIRRFNEDVNNKGFGQSTSVGLKLGLDFHGVIDAIPETFAFLTQAIVKNGGEVHIITGGSIAIPPLTGFKGEHEQDIVAELKKFGVVYTHIFSIRDYHDELDTPKTGVHAKYGFPTISDEEWDRTKGDYCRYHNIGLHIDDTLVYNDHFTTPFARIWTHSNNPKASWKDPKYIS